MENRKRAGAWSAGLCNAGMLLYVVWLLVPAIQTTGRSYTGAAAVLLFGVGVALDGETLAHGASAARFGARAALCLLLPFLLRRFLERGGANGAGFYVQQAMFWFPLLWCGYAQERDDARLWRWLEATLIAAMAVTTLTTIGWLVQGILRGGGEKVYAYSRSLGYGEPGNEAYLKELMGRNIGGYDFIYASTLSLPVVCWAITQARGWKRAAWTALCAAQTVMIVLSQYTTATLMAALILAAELLAALLRRVFRARGLSATASLLWALVPLAAVYLAREPLTGALAALCERAGFDHMATSARQLLTLVSGGGVDSASRLESYRAALDGIARSPLLGSLLGGEPMLSQHSDLLDLVSGLGLLGAAAFLGGVWVIGRGSLRGLRQSPAWPHLLLQLGLLAALCAVGTVVYSRDIALVVCLGGALLARKNTLQMPENGTK